MKLFNKIKNILFEEDETDIPVINKEETKQEETKEYNLKTESEPSSRFKNVMVNDESNKVVEHQEITREESSPFQQFDEEEFERQAAINKNRLLERDRKLREEKARVNPNDYEPVKSKDNALDAHLKEHNYMSERSNRHVDLEPKKEINVPKRFTPSPVISPVYGILDKNYKKEDILPRASSDGTLPKVIDVDSVRKKAFGALEEDIATSDNSTTVLLANNDTEIINDDDDKYIDTTEIKITSFADDEPIENLNATTEFKENNNDDIDYEDTEELKSQSNKTIEELDNMISDQDNKAEIDKTKKEEDNLESDLFNLIDSMYQDKEGNN